MGTWGSRIFENDDACDIRGTYEEVLTYGGSPQEAERITISVNEIGENDEGWLALAATEWLCGRELSAYVREKALEIIENGESNDEWETEKQRCQRKKHLEELRNKLLSPLPRPKRLKPLPCFRTPWKMGDVIAVQMPEENEFPDLSGKFALMHLIHIVRYKYSEYAPDDQYTEIPYFLVYYWSGSEDELKNIDAILEKHQYAVQEIHTQYFSNERAMVWLQFRTMDMASYAQLPVVGNVPSPDYQQVIDRFGKNHHETANIFSLPFTLQRFLARGSCISIPAVR